MGIDRRIVRKYRQVLHGLRKSKNSPRDFVILYESFTVPKNNPFLTGNY